MALKKLPVYTGTVPIRDSQAPIEFATNVGTYIDYTNGTFVPNMNTLVTDINTVVSDINNTATTVDDLATTAQNAADNVLGAMNYKGDWIAGYNTVGYGLADSVTYNDRSYISKVDNNLTEPTLDISTTEWNYVPKIAYPFSTGTYSTTDGDDARITNTNIFGVTTISLEDENVEVKLLGNMAFVIVTLSLSGYFGKVLASDTLSFKYNLLDALKTITDIISVAGGGVGVSNFMLKDAFSGYELARQSCYTSASTDGSIYFSGAGIDSGTLNIDTIIVQGTYMLKVERS